MKRLLCLVAGLLWLAAAAVQAQGNTSAPAASATAPSTAPSTENSPSTTAATPLLLELLAPRAEGTAPLVTERSFVNVLGRTRPGTPVRVGGEAVTVFSTGVFARDRVPLALGANTVNIEAGVGSEALNTTLQIERIAPPAAVVWPSELLFIDGSSLRPADTVRVAPGEALEVAARATKGQRVEARLAGQKTWTPLIETGAGRYRALLSFEGQGDIEPAPVQIRLSSLTLTPPRGARKLQPLLALTPGLAGQWRHDPERLVAAGPEGAGLLFGTHEVRLGGPFLSELPAGTLFHVTGQSGEHLRVQLAPQTTVWVLARSVQAAAPGTAAPRIHFTNLSLVGSAEGDVLTVPLAAAVPYAVQAVSDAGGRHSLQIDLYGAHHATTWISHRAGARVVREVSTEQVAPGQVRIRLSLPGPRLWGWKLERTATALRITVRPPPVLTAGASPLAGLRVALEAGHGGAQNLGAVGATGVPEKDINRWTVEALEKELIAVGAQVVIVREGDQNPNLRERVQRVLSSDAQLFVSVHANATDTGGGYLRVSGASTFYKHSPSRDLAAAVHQRLLQRTGLDDFGLVGNFNYTPTRLVTWMPSVLVEQAFVSHPGDEAKLLDPDFRALIAQAVRQGLEDFLRLP